MKKDYQIIVGILVFMVGVYWVQIPLHDLLNRFVKSDTQSTLITSILSRGVIFVVLLVIIQRLRLVS